MDTNVMIGIAVTIVVIIPLIVSFFNKPADKKPVRTRVIKKTN